eukprot:scaffold28544_cov78-Attheya_sp.AAC.1
MQSGDGKADGGSQQRQSLPFVTPPRPKKRSMSEKNHASNRARSTRRKGVQELGSDDDAIKEKICLTEVQLSSAFESIEGLNKGSLKQI